MVSLGGGLFLVSEATMYTPVNIGAEKSHVRYTPVWLLNLVKRFRRYCLTSAIPRLWSIHFIPRSV